MIRFLTEVGNTLLLQETINEAGSFLKQAVEQSLEIDDQLLRIRTSYIYAIFLYKSGIYEKAEAYFESALSITSQALHIEEIFQSCY